jgi:hypothetical protein
MGVTDSEPPENEQHHDERAVTVHRSTSDRVVFVEQDNSDAWIATDLSVEPRE